MSAAIVSALIATLIAGGVEMHPGVVAGCSASDDDSRPGAKACEESADDSDEHESGSADDAAAGGCGIRNDRPIESGRGPGHRQGGIALAVRRGAALIRGPPILA